jgi:hypothetical protein
MERFLATFPVADEESDEARAIEKEILALFISRNAANIRGNAGAIASVDPDGSNVADMFMPRQIRDSHVCVR